MNDEMTAALGASHYTALFQSVQRELSSGYEGGADVRVVVQPDDDLALCHVRAQSRAGVALSYELLRDVVDSGRLGELAHTVAAKLADALKLRRVASLSVEDLTVSEVTEGDEKPWLEQLIEAHGYHSCPGYWATHLDLFLGEIEHGAYSRGERIDREVLRRAVLALAIKWLGTLGGGWALPRRDYYGHGHDRGPDLQIRVYLDKPVRRGRRVVLLNDPDGV